MTAPLRWLRVAPALLVVLAATLAAAPAQEDCPPQSRSPQCAGSPDDGDTTSGGGSTQTPDSAQTPDRGQAPTTPPGQEPDSAPEEPTDPRPDRGTNGPSTGTADEAPTSPSRPPRRTTPEPPSDGASGADDPATSGGEGSADAAVPAPPPDLGARRVLATQLTVGPAGVQVAVDVEEARARGVDGGWTVTITGAPGVDTTVDARSRRPDGPVGLIIGRTPQHVGAPRGFTVVGQRSTTVYDASYSGRLPFDPSRADGPAVITVTLFQ